MDFDARTRGFGMSSFAHLFSVIRSPLSGKEMSERRMTRDSGVVVALAAAALDLVGRRLCHSTPERSFHSSQGRHRSRSMDCSRNGTLRASA